MVGDPPMMSAHGSIVRGDRFESGVRSVAGREARRLAIVVDHLHEHVVVR